jgi:hypothetical protein
MLMTSFPSATEHSSGSMILDSDKKHNHSINSRRRFVAGGTM